MREGEVVVVYKVLNCCVVRRRLVEKVWYPFI
jgi:hypothetical protein